MQGHDAIIRMMVASGVKTVFNYMAEDTMMLIAALTEEWSDEVDVVHSRHEQGAMAMTDGYARSGDEIGVCVVGRGPAIAQTGTALINARKRGSKLLVIVPEPALRDTHDVKEFKQEAYLEATAENVVSIRSHETLVPKFREALRKVHLGESPLVVQIPKDILDEDMGTPTDLDSHSVPPGLSQAAAEDEVTASSTVVPDEAVLERVVEYYLDSDAYQPPVILCGRGAMQADAKDAVIELAEQTSAVLVTTLEGRGYFSDHPMYLGFTGNWGSPLANEYLTEANFVLAIGCSLNNKTVDDGYLINDDATVIHIDTDPTSIGRYTPVDLAIVGDARETAEALTETFAANDIDREGELWTDGLREEVESFDILEGQEFPDVPDTIDPRELMRTLDEHLPHNRLIGTDGGHFRKWILDGIHAHPDDSIVACDFAAVGLGMPLNIGAAQYLKQTESGEDEPRLSIVFCGDAGFMMSLQELETAARNDLPILVVVINDSSLGAEYHSLISTNRDPDVALLPTPDLATVAESLGATGYAATSIDEVKEAIDDIGTTPDGPVVLECIVNPEIRHRTY